MKMHKRKVVLHFSLLRKHYFWALILPLSMLEQKKSYSNCKCRNKAKLRLKTKKKCWKMLRGKKRKKEIVWNYNVLKLQNGRLQVLYNFKIYTNATHISVMQLIEQIFCFCNSLHKLSSCNFFLDEKLFYRSGRNTNYIYFCWLPWNSCK